MTIAEAQAIKVQVGTTYGQAAAAGLIPTTPEERQKEAESLQPMGIVGILKNMSKELLTAQTAPEAWKQWAVLTGGAKTQLNQTAKAYHDLVASAGFVLCRYVFGHGANISDLDINRILLAIPSFYDTATTARIKWEALDAIMHGTVEARRRAMYGIFGRDIEIAAKPGTPKLNGKDMTIDDIYRNMDKIDPKKALAEYMGRSTATRQFLKER